MFAHLSPLLLPPNYCLPITASTSAIIFLLPTGLPGQVALALRYASLINIIHLRKLRTEQVLCTSVHRHIGTCVAPELKVKSQYHSSSPDSQISSYVHHTYAPSPQV